MERFDCRYYCRTVENSKGDDQETFVEKSLPVDSNLTGEKTSVEQQHGEVELSTEAKQEPQSEAIEEGANEQVSKEEDALDKGNEEREEEIEAGAPALMSSIADVKDGEKLDQEQSSSSQKRVRGRRKKFKTTTTDRTDMNT